MKKKDGISLPRGDFRRKRRYLAPWLFALPGNEEGKVYPPPSDLISEEAWDEIMVLPTDVALKSTSYVGSRIARLITLHTDWIFSMPEWGEAPFIMEPSMLAEQEFDAVVFNATCGWYRQGLGCLRNALEALTIGAALSVHPNGSLLFEEWQRGSREIALRHARVWLRDSELGKEVDADVAHGSVFGDESISWVKARYQTLCHYAHSRAGYNNFDFWIGNGPVYVPRALKLVEREMRETLALSYLLMRLAWPEYEPGKGQGPASLLAGKSKAWSEYLPMLHKWLGV